MGQKSSRMRKKSLSDSGTGPQESGHWGYIHPRVSPVLRLTPDVVDMPFADTHQRVSSFTAITAWSSYPLSTVPELDNPSTSERFMD